MWDYNNVLLTCIKNKIIHSTDKRFESDNVIISNGVKVGSCVYLDEDSIFLYDALPQLQLYFHCSNVENTLSIQKMD